MPATNLAVYLAVMDIETVAVVLVTTIAGGLALPALIAVARRLWHTVKFCVQLVSWAIPVCVVSAVVLLTLWLVEWKGVPR